MKKSNTIFFLLSMVLYFVLKAQTKTIHSALNNQLSTQKTGIKAYSVKKDLFETCRYIARMTRNRSIWYGDYPIQIAGRDSLETHPEWLEKMIWIGDNVTFNNNALQAKIMYLSDTLTFVWRFFDGKQMIRLDDAGYFTFTCPVRHFYLKKGEDDFMPMKSHSTLKIDYGKDAQVVLKAFKHFYRLQGIRYEELFSFPAKKK